jgi:hypothetical protein
LLSLLPASYWHSRRWQQERDHAKVQMVLDFNSLVELARSRGQTWEEVLPEFSQRGVSALAFAELRAEELENYGICSLYSGVALGADTGQGSGGPNQPNPQYSYLVQWSPHPLMSFSALETACADAFGREKVRPFSSHSERLRSAQVLEIGLPVRTVQGIGICFPSWGLTAAQHHKLDVWLRPENKPPITREAVWAYLGRLRQYQGVEGLIFGGSSNEVLGYGADLSVLEETARLIGENGWKLGFIELPKITQQKGVETLVRQLPTQTVRVFTVPPAQQATLKPPRVAQMYTLAARERNLTLLYLRPYAYDPSPDKGFEHANDDMFGAVFQQLQSKDLLGKAATFRDQVEPDRASLAWMSLAGLSAFWLVVLGYVSVPSPLIVASLVAFAVLNLVAAKVPLWAAAMALGTSCTASLLATVSQFPSLRKAATPATFGAIMTESTRCWLRMFVISLCGAWIASCFLQATTYKLGLDVFRGVKVVTVLMPVAITLAWMLSAPERGHWLRISYSPLKLYQLVALGILAVGGIIYTMRTGNMAGTDVGDSMEGERYLRMVLDQALGVRPRFKEFLLAHPAMLLAPLFLRWGWREATAVMILVGATGQCGQLDTFAHVHTPLYVSLIRCLLGALLGGLLGWLYAGILWSVAKGARWVQRKIPVSS